MDPKFSEQEVEGSSRPPQEWAPATRFYRQLTIAALSLVLLAGFVFLLEKFAAILQQLLTAALLAYIILPMQRWLVRRHIPAVLAYLLIILAIVGLGTMVALTVQSSFEDLSTKLPSYQKNFTQLVERIAQEVPELEEHVLKPLRERDSGAVDRSLSAFRSALGSLVSFTSQAFVVLIYLIFLMAEQSGATRRIESAFGPERGLYILGVVKQINDSIAEYIFIKTLMSVLGGVLTALVLFSFGVDYPILWGVIAFLLNYIPYLGSLTATVLPVLLAAVQLQSLTMALLLLVVLAAVQNGIGYGIEPFLAGRRMNLSPLVIILALSFWGGLWGIVGMILAIPLVVTFKIILENIPATRPLAILLSNG